MLLQRALQFRNLGLQARVLSLQPTQTFGVEDASQLAGFPGEGAASPTGFSTAGGSTPRCRSASSA